MGKQTKARDRRSTEFGSGSDFVRCPDTTQFCLFGSMREKKRPSVAIFIHLISCALFDCTLTLILS